MGKVGGFLVGAALIAGAAFIPGIGAVAAGVLKSVMVTAGVGLTSSAVFGRGVVHRQDGIQLNDASTLAPLPVLYGRTRVGLRLADVRETGSGNKVLYYVGALGHGSSDGSGIQAIDEIYLDEVLAVDAAGTIHLPFAPGTIAVTKHLGTDAQTVDTGLNTAFGGGGTPAWPTTSAGKGIAYLVVVLTFDPDVFPGGIPQATVVVRGNKVFDVRTSTWGYSTNPALAIYDLLTSTRYGARYTAAEIDTASFIAMANYYDEVVANDVGTQKRFEVNGWLDVSQEVMENVRQLLSSCRGMLVWQGGQLRLLTRRPTTPTTFALTEHNLVGDISYTLPGVAETPNKIRYRFIREKDDAGTYLFAPDELIWPRPEDTNPYLTADNGYEVVADIELPMTTDRFTAEQIAMVTLREMRAGKGVTCTALEEALQVQVGDVVPFTHSTPGFVAKPFWPLGIYLSPDSTVRFGLVEYDVNAYSLNAQATFPATPSTNLPNPFTVVAPTGLSLAAGDAQRLIYPDGTFAPRILVQWTASTDAYLDYYNVRFQRTGDAQWIAGSKVLRADVALYLDGIMDGQNYTVEVQAVNSLGRPSAWVSAAITVTLNSPRFTSAVVEDFSTQYPGRRWSRRDGGTNVPEQIPEPAASNGAQLLRCTGAQWWMDADPTSYEVARLYVLAVRLRQWKDPSAGSKQILLGLQAFDLNGQFITVFGGTGEGAANWIAYNGTLAQSSTFTTKLGYAQGWAGGLVTVAAGDLSQSGLFNFSAANLVDGLPTTKGFDWNGSTTGAYLQIDLGSAKKLSRLGLYLNGATTGVPLKLQYADAAGGPYTDASGGAWSAGVVGAPSGLALPGAGWTEGGWDTSLAGTHRYWRLVLTANVTTAPNVMGLSLYEITLANPDRLSADPYDPVLLPPGTKAVKRVWLVNWSNGTDGIVDIDSVILAVPSGQGVDTFADEARRRGDTFYASDGILLSAVLAKDGGAQARPLVKGKQVLGPYKDTDTALFSPVFQFPPAFRLDGGANYYGDDGGWSAAFSATVGQFDNSSLINLTAAQGTVRAELRQRGTPTSKTNDFAGTVLDVADEADAVVITWGGGGAVQDDQFTVRGRLTFEAKAKISGIYEADLRVAIDTAATAGTWVQRATATMHGEFTVIPSTQTSDFAITVVATGIPNGTANTGIRLRFLGVANESGLGTVLTAQCVGNTGGNNNGLHGISYATAADNIHSKTRGNELVITVTAEGYV